jgi:transketolase
VTFTTDTPIRDAFGRALVELGARDERVVALTADLAEAIRVHWFAEAYPDRFFQMGVAEQDMIGTAAGLACGGKIPFATTFAVFASSRANEQVRLAVAYNRANVKISVSHGGLTVGEDGATHQAVEDIALMRALPGMTVVVPCDANQAWAATMAAAAHEGPIYLRLGRVPTPILTGPETPFRIGQARLARPGNDVAIISTGTVLALALQAAEALEAGGFRARVIDMHTVKPLDAGAVVSAARDCGAIVTVEDHSVIGGLGGAVAEVLAREHPTPIEFVGIQDTFGESGRPAELLAKYGLTTEAVVAAARRALSRKERTQAVPA